MRIALTWMSALLLCGCLGRGNADLLQARLREQQQHLAEVERQKETAVAELERSHRESEMLRAELDRSGKRVMAAEYTESLVRASKLQINSLMSGGLNRDDQPGDDSLVAYVSLVDEDGEVIKLPGIVELSLFDPTRPEPSRQVGQWRFTSEECRKKWTRGLTGAGYQFTVPVEQTIEHDQLVLHAKLTTADNRTFDATQLIRFTLPEDHSPRRVAVPDNDLQPLDDINDPPPPAAASTTTGTPRFSDSADEWADEVSSAPPNRPTVESTNWAKDDFPRRR